MCWPCTVWIQVWIPITDFCWGGIMCWKWYQWWCSWLFLVLKSRSTYFASVWVCNYKAYWNEHWNESEKLCVCVLVLCIFLTQQQSKWFSSFWNDVQLTKGHQLCIFSLFLQFFLMSSQIFWVNIFYIIEWGIGSCKSLHWVLNVFYGNLDSGVVLELPNIGWIFLSCLFVRDCTNPSRRCTHGHCPAGR